MFCPKCGEQNLDDAKFCRICGANVSLIPQALQGELPDEVEADNEKHVRGVKYTVISLGLVLLAIVVYLLAPAHDAWAVFFATMIAACIMFGIGMGEFVGARQGKRIASRKGSETAELDPGQTAGELPPARESVNVITPASVTENTTRRLGAEIRTERPRPD